MSTLKLTPEAQALVNWKRKQVLTYLMSFVDHSLDRPYRRMPQSELGLSNPGKNLYHGRTLLAEFFHANANKDKSMSCETLSERPSFFEPIHAAQRKRKSTGLKCKKHTTITVGRETYAIVPFKK